MGTHDSIINRRPILSQKYIDSPITVNRTTSLRYQRPSNVQAGGRR
jgi:hypothetical protein